MIQKINHVYNGVQWSKETGFYRLYLSCFKLGHSTQTQRMLSPLLLGPTGFLGPDGSLHARRQIALAEPMKASDEQDLKEGTELIL